MREQESIDEMPAIDGELRVIDGLLRDLESRRTRTQKTAAATPIEFHLRFSRASYKHWQIGSKQIVPFDHIGIAFLNERGDALESSAFRFLCVSGIDDDQFFPARIVRERDAHQVLVERKNFELEPAEFFEGQSFKECPARVREIVLHRIAQREKAAAGILQSISERDQFLPAVDANPPA